MKTIPVVILAGGFGTRLREQTEYIPKPMVSIGPRPILLHIMKLYAHYGFKRFIICLGYKGEVIKDYFINYKVRNSDFTVTLGNKDAINIHNSFDEEDWEVTLSDTGLSSMTGARIKRIEHFIDTEDFLLTYGDGVADIDLSKLVEFHKSHGKTATITGVRPPSRFGEMIIKEKRVVEFGEKPQTGGSTINGGFFVFKRGVFKYLSENEDCTLEKEPLERLANDGELMSYDHAGFWQCMDTMRDVNLLNKYWESGKAPWKCWKD